MKNYPIARIRVSPADGVFDAEDLFQIGDASLIGRLGPIPLGSFVPFVQPRSAGEFGGRAFYLPVGCDWTLAKDSEGCTVLIPSREK